MEFGSQPTSMTPMSPPPGDLAALVSEEGSWVRQSLAHGDFEAWHFILHGSVGAAPTYVVVRPAPGGDPAAVARGVTTTVLREVRPSEAASLVRDNEHEVQKYPRAHQVDNLLASARRPSGPYLAALALRYERLAAAGDRSPVRRLVDITALPLGTVKSHLQLARRKGFLEAVGAKAGGRATEAAHRVLARAEEDAATGSTEDRS
ncbi:hypothetical protein Shyd_86180 [Streptomyces hydrogenans]|uniref:Uncharacterized protein n=3 Tax=Streptomyces hydrogenans TaxID=1873719 RepID=A0ABQ3PQD9_9ACTN|nr:hypothetical protein GCM10018784_74250 [Streptomyces hydrogenans]GHI27247.1 hypothetical protein Shyd_86180 [Streptomyces hydrogenans]